MKTIILNKTSISLKAVNLIPGLETIKITDTQIIIRVRV